MDRWIPGCNGGYIGDSGLDAISILPQVGVGAMSAGMRDAGSAHAQGWTRAFVYSSQELMPHRISILFPVTILLPTRFSTQR